MKKYCIALIIAAIYGCGSAADGDASTDTTNMPLDTTTSINTSSGSESITPPPLDSTRAHTTTGTSPESRSTTPGQDSGRR